MFSLFKRKKIGLALGGGAARGLAHIGVIKALQEKNIQIDYVSGISAGSIIAGLFAAGINIDILIETALKIKPTDIAKLHICRAGFATSEPIEKLVIELVGDLRFKDLKIPFITAATDIISGTPYIFKDPETKLAQAIRASATFPGIFSPYEYDGKKLLDGGIMGLVPISLVKELGANYVIGVNVIPKTQLTDIPHNFSLIGDRCLDLLLTQGFKHTFKDADILIEPVTTDINSLQINKAEELIEQGYQSTLSLL